jgi:hypothetical protein
VSHSKISLAYKQVIDYLVTVKQNPQPVKKLRGAKSNLRESDDEFEGITQQHFCLPAQNTQTQFNSSLSPQIGAIEAGFSAVISICSGGRAKVWRRGMRDVDVA